MPLWNGYRLYAGDGSTVRLPPSASVKKYFGVESVTGQGTERSLARIFMVYSVMARFVHDSEIGVMPKGEKTMLTDSLERAPLGENAILLLDRGFGNICVAKELQNRGIDFCISILVTMSNFAKTVQTCLCPQTSLELPSLTALWEDRKPTHPMGWNHVSGLIMTS